jgi:hypothetical protein
MPHAAIAVGLHGLRPFGEEANRFVADRGVAGRAVHARHAAEPLAEDGVAVPGAPTAQRFARRGQSRRGAIAVQDVVLGEAEPEIARGLVLLLPAAVAETHAGVIERFDFDLAGSCGGC